LISVSDAEMSEKINKEWTVEILAQLVENKPVSKLALSDECFNLGDSLGFSEVSVHPHVEQLISDPGGFYLNSSVQQSK